MIRNLNFNNAFALFLEDKIGSIDPGKYAGLIVLSKNLFQLKPAEIDRTGVIMALFHGDIVYQAITG